MRSIRPFVLSIVAVMFVVATVLVSTEASARTWKTDKSSIEGEFDSLQDNGTKVRIKRSDGKFVRVDLYKLSEEDQQYIKQITSESGDDFEEEAEESVFEEEKESTPSTIPSVPEEDNAVENLIKTAKLLEKKGEYLVARQKLSNSLKNDFSFDVANYWIKSDTDLLNSIKLECNCITQYTLDESKLPKDKKSAAKQGLQLGWEMIKNGGFSPSLVQDYKFLQKKMNDFLSENLKRSTSMRLLDKDEISSTLDRFEVLKKSISELQTIVENELVYSDDNEYIDKISKLSQQLKKLKNSVREKRTSFLSYNVVSPYLAEANRGFIIAEINRSFLDGPEKDSFDKAIKMLSFACHGQHLYECNDDVRNQFFNVQKALKSMVSSSEFEELKVLTTLQDSSDSSKKRGADAWWE